MARWFLVPTPPAYVWNANAGAWQNVATSATIPSGLYSANSGTYGVSEIQIASSTTPTLYMKFNGYVLVSINRGTSWTNTGLTQDTNE